MHDHEKIITPDAIRYIRELHEKFNGRRLQLLAEREILQAAIDRGDYYPDFDKATKALRNDTKWKGSKIPDDMMVGQFSQFSLAMCCLDYHFRDKGLALALLRSNSLSDKTRHAPSLGDPPVKCLILMDIRFICSCG